MGELKVYCGKWLFVGVVTGVTSVKNILEETISKGETFKTWLNQFQSVNVIIQLLYIQSGIGPPAPSISKLIVLFPSIAVVVVELQDHP